ncbi:MAG: deoxyribodipyrimidine photo-lyase [Chitinophagaceae bacterium]|nr:MAG: deoxyribodipyrimidine photo-lyase [Chitinophagaceae bacterium]
MEKVNLFWFRRDLRLQDNAGLYHALKSGNPVVPIFIFDKNILDDLEDKSDARVNFIHDTIHEMQDLLLKKKSTLDVHYGKPIDVFKQLVERYNVEDVFTNHDYEPYARDRDEEIGNFLAKNDIGFHSYKDQVIFEKNEVIKDDGTPYTVFTPYSKKWLATLTKFYLKPYPTSKYHRHFFQQSPGKIPSLDSMGFKKKEFEYPSSNPRKPVIEQYDKQRDIPGIPGTSRVGLHLRFGTISIRELASTAKELNDVYLKELIWRDFYQMILWHFPKVGKGLAFRAEYDNIKWRNNEEEFKRWCNGTTGYPIVDAGMRELNETGFMHNRIRMVTASFLAKHLLIDWRWGEAYFAEKLLDFEFASNNGGWQWAAGSGCDAAPYFRIFNPYRQTEKFDKDFRYIRKWVPEFEEFTYPKPVVEHEVARKRCLEVYTQAVRKS